MQRFFEGNMNEVEGIYWLVNDNDAKTITANKSTGDLAAVAAAVAQTAQNTAASNMSPLNVLVGKTQNAKVLPLAMLTSLSVGVVVGTAATLLLALNKNRRS